jgi:hypothetical protein
MNPQKGLLGRSASGWLRFRGAASVQQVFHFLMVKGILNGNTTLLGNRHGEVDIGAGEEPDFTGE